MVWQGEVAWPTKSCCSSFSMTEWTVVQRVSMDRLQVIDVGGAETK